MATGEKQVLSTAGIRPIVHGWKRSCPTHPFNGPLSGTTQVSQYQKGKTNLEQETVSGSGISWAICKSAPRSRQITTPAPHCSVFYKPDALPATQPTVSKHWRLNRYQPAENGVKWWSSDRCDLVSATSSDEGFVSPRWAEQSHIHSETNFTQVTSRPVRITARSSCH